MNKVIGIIFDHGDDEWSVWLTDNSLSAREQGEIRKICDNHLNDGCSVRGKDVCKTIERMIEE